MDVPARRRGRSRGRSSCRAGESPRRTRSTRADCSPRRRRDRPRRAPVGSSPRRSCSSRAGRQRGFRSSDRRCRWRRRPRRGRPPRHARRSTRCGGSRPRREGRRPEPPGRGQARLVPRRAPIATRRRWRHPDQEKNTVGFFLDPRAATGAVTPRADGSGRRPRSARAIDCWRARGRVGAYPRAPSGRLEGMRATALARHRDSRGAGPGVRQQTGEGLRTGP